MLQLTTEGKGGKKGWWNEGKQRLIVIIGLKVL